MWLRLQNYLARRWGFYRYEGLESFAAIRGYPLGRVRYPDGERSMWMALGNAYDYAEMLGGEVETDADSRPVG